MYSFVKGKVTRLMPHAVNYGDHYVARHVELIVTHNG